MLNIHLTTHNIDIVCVTEHWCREADIEYSPIQGYKLVSCYCRTTLERGGVCLFARDELDLTPLKLNYSVEQQFEMCAGVINSNNGLKTYIIVVYRTPDSNFEVFIHKLEVLLHQIYNPKHHYIICGDINTNFLINSHRKEVLINFFATYNIIHQINVPTRISKSTSTCIDNIFSNCEVTKSAVHNSYLSDHTYQICTFILDISKSYNVEYIYSRNFSANNIQTFADILNVESWEEMYMAKNFENKFDCFNETFCYHYNCVFPMIKKMRKRTKKRWFSPEIKVMHSQLCEMEKLVRQLQNPVYTARYKEFKTLYKNSIYNHRKNVNNSRLTQSNNVMRESWKIINETRHGNVTTKQIQLKLNDKDDPITDTTEIQILVTFLVV